MDYLPNILFIALFVGFSVWFFRDTTKPLEPQRKSGRVGYVIDGDTIILSGTGERLRLWGVDAAEQDAEGFQRARNALIDMVENKKITFIKIEGDRYGRTVARVFVKNREINRLLIEQGYTKEFCKYSKGFYGHC